MPYTSSPGWNAVTSVPTASTVPARLRPGFGALGARSPKPASAHRVRQAGHDVPRAPVDAGGVHPHQHLVVADRRPVDVREPQHVSGVVPYASWTIASHGRRSPASASSVRRAWSCIIAPISF